MNWRERTTAEVVGGYRYTLVQRGRRWWWEMNPTREDEGMGLECGPFLTRWGARLRRRLYG